MIPACEVFQRDGPLAVGKQESENQVGTATGLAWTETGGDLLSIEAVTMPGKDGKVRKKPARKPPLKLPVRDDDF